MTRRFLTVRFHILVALAAIVTTACGGTTTPTAPTSMPGATSIALTEGATWSAMTMAAGRADLAACFAGTGGASCFGSDRAGAATVAAAPVTTPPLNLTATVIANTVSLVWTPPATQDAPVSSYVVEAANVPNFAVPNLANFDTGDPLTSLTAPGVPPGTYYVRIRARNALGLSAPSNEVVVVVGGAGPGSDCPTAPRFLTATAPAAGAILLSWQPPLTGRVDTYMIEAGSAPLLANIVNFNTGSAALSFSTAGVPPGTYHIRVRAVASGCAASPASNEVTFASGSAAPGPGGTHAVTVTLSYTCAPCSADPDNYALFVCPAGGRCSGVRATSPVRSPNTLTVNAQLPPGTHHVEVRATRFLGSWTLAFRSPPPVAGGVVPNSFRIVQPPGSTAFTPGDCSLAGRLMEAFFSFEVRAGAAGVC